MHTGRNRPPRAVPSHARLGEGAEVGARAGGLRETTWKWRGTGCGGRAQREPGLRPSSGASATPSSVSADAGGQRGEDGRTGVAVFAPGCLLALPCLAWPRLALPHLASPCLALPRLALPCLALPCLALVRFASLLVFLLVSCAACGLRVDSLSVVSGCVASRCVALRCVAFLCFVLFCFALLCFACWVLLACFRPSCLSTVRRVVRAWTPCRSPVALRVRERGDTQRFARCWSAPT